MAPPDRYPVPARRHRAEDHVRRSRFITTVDRARTREEAEAFIDEVRGEFPDATHNCWAFVAGPPASTTVVGEVAAVVTRYFGGVKLGKGGLGRAYAGGVTHALEGMPRRERIERRRLRVACDYAARDPLLRLALDLEADLVAEDYGAHVTLVFHVPVTNMERLTDGIAALTGGQAILQQDV
ncbi:MAG: YigZ family protein [Gemmatimonadetes bacterium]|nr:YigZ family protein [Gemmatimonadota bacterium]